MEDLFKKDYHITNLKEDWKIILNKICYLSEIISNSKGGHNYFTKILHPLEPLPLSLNYFYTTNIVYHWLNPMVHN